MGKTTAVFLNVRKEEELLVTRVKLRRKATKPVGFKPLIHGDFLTCVNIIPILCMQFCMTVI